MHTDLLSQNVYFSEGSSRPEGRDYSTVSADFLATCHILAELWLIPEQLLTSSR